jgi:hypothetical protein
MRQSLNTGYLHGRERPDGKLIEVRLYPADCGAYTGPPDGLCGTRFGTVTVDDYAEVWVNGAIPGRSGYPSPATIQGHNVPNRVLLSTGVKAGDKFQIAVFGINGPISMAPANTVWFPQATMEFYK